MVAKRLSSNRSNLVLVMEDSTFALFLGFACLWVLLGIGGIVLLLKSEQQSLQVRQGLLVMLPIVIPFLIALIVGTLALT